MRLKSFYAKTMSEAMKIVRDTLGEDAVIVATREEAGGKSVSVTAAVDNDAYERHQDTTQRLQNFIRDVENGAISEDDDTGLYGDDDDAYHSDPEKDGDWVLEGDEDSVFHAEDEAINEILTDVMIRHGASAEVTDEILSCAAVLGLGDARRSLVAALDNLYDFRPLPKTAARRALMMVGPPGSGKTLAVAKIAARGIMDGLSVGVITTDIVRAGGVEQLRAFTKILDIELVRASNHHDLKDKLEAMQDFDQVLIDTGGANPFDPAEMKEIVRLMTAGAVEPVLVLAAGADAHESSDIARTFSAIGTKWLLPTRLDIARRIGGVLTAAHQGSMTLADASATAQVADGLTTLSPNLLADFLMPRKKEKQMKQDKYKRGYDRNNSSSKSMSYSRQKHTTKTG